MGVRSFFRKALCGLVCREDHYVRFQLEDTDSTPSRERERYKDTVIHPSATKYRSSNVEDSYSYSGSSFSLDPDLLIARSRPLTPVNPDPDVESDLWSDEHEPNSHAPLHPSLAKLHSSRSAVRDAGDMFMRQRRPLERQPLSRIIEVEDPVPDAQPETTTLPPRLDLPLSPTATEWGARVLRQPVTVASSARLDLPTSKGSHKRRVSVPKKSATAASQPKVPTAQGVDERKVPVPKILVTTIDPPRVELPTPPSATEWGERVLNQSGTAISAPRAELPIPRVAPERKVPVPKESVTRTNPPRQELPISQAIPERRDPVHKKSATTNDPPQLVLPPSLSATEWGARVLNHPVTATSPPRFEEPLSRTISEWRERVVTPPMTSTSPPRLDLPTSPTASEWGARVLRQTVEPDRVSRASTQALVGELNPQSVPCKEPSRPQKPVEVSGQDPGVQRPERTNDGRTPPKARRSRKPSGPLPPLPNERHPLPPAPPAPKAKSPQKPTQGSQATILPTPPRTASASPPATKAKSSPKSSQAHPATTRSSPTPLLLPSAGVSPVPKAKTDHKSVHVREVTARAPTCADSTVPLVPKAKSSGKSAQAPPATTRGKSGRPSSRTDGSAATNTPAKNTQTLPKKKTSSYRSRSISGPKKLAKDPSKPRVRIHEEESYRSTHQIGLQVRHMNTCLDGLKTSVTALELMADYIIEKERGDIRPRPPMTSR